MAIYLISGKLGSGKTLSAVGRIRDALLAGRRVVTNLDLRLEHLLPPRAGKPRVSGSLEGGTRSVVQPVSALRLPDKPTVEDLEMIGCGNESMDESQNGLIVLDELAAWLNARTFNDKSRGPVIDWLIHSRKKGWDVMFICQHIEQIDKQIRTALVEYLVVCRRLDRMRIPLVGGAIKAISAGYLSGTMPKVHVASVRYGVSPDAIKADTWIYQGKDLYRGYDTRQIFTDDQGRECFVPAMDDSPAKIEGAASGVYSYLPPWHLGGYLHKSPMEKFREWLNPPRSIIAHRPKLPLVQLLAGLHPDDAVKHWHRLDRLGAF